MVAEQAGPTVGHRQLGYSGPQFSANGAQVAAHLGGTTSTVPKPGAVMSYGSGFGHVVVAEEVSHDAQGRLTVRVSEMNTGSDHSSALVGNPQEYSSSRIMTQNSDGTWSTGPGAHVVVTVANPTYGTPRI